jgi:hypothetical protein
VGDERPVRVPDGLPRSPSGRVPQWVLDEAAGRTVSPVPFRGATITPGLRRPDGRRGGRPGGRTARLAAALAFAGALAAAGLQLQGGASLTEAPVSDAAQAFPAADVPPPSLDESPEPLGTPPAAPAMREGDDYRFSRVHEDGSPVTWSPCRPIRYVTRPDHAPPWGSALVAEAVARIQAATGLQFEDAGVTTEAPSDKRDIHQPDEYGDRWAPVLIAWDEIPDRGTESVLGKAGAYRVPTASGEETYVSGSLHLDHDDISELVAVSGPAAGRAVVLHELGHLVGLDHVSSDVEVMAAEWTGVTELGPGDRAGLAELGRGSCQSDA